MSFIQFHSFEVHIIRLIKTDKPLLGLYNNTNIVNVNKGIISRIPRFFQELNHAFNY